MPSRSISFTWRPSLIVRAIKCTFHCTSPASPASAFELRAFHQSSQITDQVMPQEWGKSFRVLCKFAIKFYPKQKCVVHVVEGGENSFFEGEDFEPETRFNTTHVFVDYDSTDYVCWTWENSTIGNKEATRYYVKNFGPKRGGMRFRSFINKRDVWHTPASGSTRDGKRGLKLWNIHSHRP